jgi:hypothetical protein
MAYRDSKWGIADNWGPYRAALSYSSKSGMASSFMFFGTAKTSVNELIKGIPWGLARTALGHLNQK